MLLKSFKTKLNPNHKQSSLFAKHADADRSAGNWGLDACFKALENDEKILSAIALHRRLIAQR